MSAGSTTPRFPSGSRVTFRCIRTFQEVVAVSINVTDSGGADKSPCTLGGYPPFTDERKDMKLEEQIIRGSYQLHEKYWRGISEDAKDLIKKLLTVDPKKRFTVTQALNHPWLKDPEMTAKANKLMFPAAAGMPPPLSTASRKRPHPGQEESHDPKTSSPVTPTLPTPPPPKRRVGDESSSSGGSGSSTSTSAMSVDSPRLSHTGMSDGVQEMILLDQGTGGLWKYTCKGLPTITTIRQGTAKRTQGQHQLLTPSSSQGAMKVIAKGALY
ncbi:Checkpoint kinase 2 [Branchiostoma belcheri]|nr:Checkpoint kinase 2 [Branchiostoma belcheri]